MFVVDGSPVPSLASVAAVPRALASVAALGREASLLTLYTRESACIAATPSAVP